MLNMHLMANPPYTDRSHRPDATFLSDVCVGSGEPHLSSRASLILALLLSGALWAVIWVAITSLTSAVVL